MISVTNNLVALNAQRQFNIVTGSKAKSIEKLSSGFRVNRAADDAAGLAISEKMRRQINGLNRGAENIQDGISMVQVADGALSEVHDLINRMNVLSVQSATGTLTDEDRGYIQQEVDGLVAEINRISKDTKFNEVSLFDGTEVYSDGYVVDGSITKLISSPSADYGYLHEAYESPAGTFWTAGTLDFGAVDAAAVEHLDGGNFKFWCSQSCDEVFDITLKSDGTPSSATNLSGQVSHYYTIDISSCKNGKEVVDTIYNYVSNHLPNGYSGSYSPGGVRVSHSNNLIKDGSKLYVVANSNSKSSYAAASSKYNSASGKSGKITCSAIYYDGAVPDKMCKSFNIQCSSNVGDIETFRIYHMDGKSLGVDPLDVSTQDAASLSIYKIKKAHAEISDHRSKLGATQNRLEHSKAINLNVAENTTAAESRIRDTDMAKEMVQYSISNILEQAGTSCLSQANQIPQSVLSLLNS